MLIENKIEIMGTFDPGSQVSLINSKWIKKKDNREDVNKILLVCQWCESYKWIGKNKNKNI